MKTIISDKEALSQENSCCDNSTEKVSANDSCCAQPKDGSSCCDKNESKTVNAAKTGCCS